MSEGEVICFSIRVLYVYVIAADVPFIANYRNGAGEADIEILEDRNVEGSYLSNEDTEKAMKDLVQDIYTDMNEVETADAVPEGLVR